MRSYFILYILLVTLFSCNNSTLPNQYNSNDELLKFSTELNTNREEYLISNFYKSIDGYELDKMGGPVGRVDKIMLSDTMLFVLDKHFAKKLFVYDLDKECRFIFSIGNRGKGPGEFLRISDFTIEEEQKHILISDMQLRKLCYYNFDGEFIKEVKLGFTPLKLGVSTDYVYIISNTYKKDSRGLQILNKNHEIVKELLPFIDYPTLTNYECGFSKSCNNLILNFPNSDTIFAVSDLELIPYAVLDTNNETYKSYLRRMNIKPGERVFFNDPNNDDERFAFKNIVIPLTYFEDNKVKIFSFFENGNYYKSFNTCEQDTNSSAIGYLLDDISGFPINFKTSNKEYGTINIVSPRAIVKAKLDTLEKNKAVIAPELVEDIKKADIDCNPFILFYKLKQNG